MQDLFTKIERDFNCTIGVCAKNISNENKSIYFRRNETFPSASIIKLFIAGVVMNKIENKEVNLFEKVKIKKENKLPGNSIVADLDINYYTIRDLLYFLLAHSDNSAQNILENIISEDDIDEFLKNFGFLKSKYVSPGNSNKNFFSTTTPEDATEILQGIWKSKYSNKELTSLILGFLHKTRDTHFGLRYVPCKLNVKNPEIVNFYSKIGKSKETVNSCVLLETKKNIFIISVFIKDIKIKKFRNNVDNQGIKLIGDVTNNIFKYLQ